MLIGMKERIGMIKNGEKGFSLGLVGTFIKVLMKLMKEMDMDRCTGKMEVITKETGLMESNMVKVTLIEFRRNLHSRLRF